jgi:hypothetical protein
MWDRARFDAANVPPPVDGKPMRRYPVDRGKHCLLVDQVVCRCCPSFEARKSWLRQFITVIELIPAVKGDLDARAKVYIRTRSLGVCLKCTPGSGALLGVSQKQSRSAA